MKRVILFVLVFFSTWVLNAQPNYSSNRLPKNHIDTLNVGFFITSIRNIDFVNSSFNADIWVWLRYKNPKNEINHDKENHKYPNCFEWVDDITEQTNEKDSMDINDPKASIIWATFKVNRKFRKKWSLGSYPFDIQHVEIKLESDYFDTNRLILTTDKAQIDSKFILNETEWMPIIDSKNSFKSYFSSWETNFGDPNADKNDKPSVYSGVSFEFKMQRLHRWITFFKLYTGILISFLIALSVFLVKPTNLDARFGLVVGSLFSSIGSKYIVDSLIPVYYQNTLFDSIHNVTFIYIFIITLLSIISLNLMESEKVDHTILSKKLDRIGLFACLISYFMIIISLVIFYKQN
jgi:hypothetical protein